MIDAGIDDKDVLVVDRSLTTKQQIAICFIDGEFKANEG
jgi:DNA polymerase V